jgi:anti-sigma factor RsiW
MMEDRAVGGIRCRHVLELLPDYIAGSLAAGNASLLEAHLRGCDWCARFGGEYAGAVAALREQLRQPAPLPPATRAALRDRLGREGIIGRS